MQCISSPSGPIKFFRAIAVIKRRFDILNGVKYPWESILVNCQAATRQCGMEKSMSLNRHHGKLQTSRDQLKQYGFDLQTSTSRNLVECIVDRGYDSESAGLKCEDFVIVPPGTVSEQCSSSGQGG